MGTPAYLAPEQIEGGSVDGRADVYSLGCLLYECLTGETPFARGSRLAVAWAHLEEEPPSASERRPELRLGIDAVIRKAMAKEPDDRYATCAALITAAEEALGLRRPPTLRRHRLSVIAAVATLCSSPHVLVAVVVLRGTLAAELRRPSRRTRSSASTRRRTRSMRSSTSARDPPRPLSAGAASGSITTPVPRSRRSTRQRTTFSRQRPSTASPADLGCLRGAGAGRRPGRCLAHRRRRSAEGHISRGCSRGLAGSASTGSTRRAPCSRGRLRRRLGGHPGNSRQPSAAHRPGHRESHQADALPHLLADRRSRRRPWRHLGRGLVHRNALPDRPSLGTRDGTARSRTTCAAHPMVVLGRIWVGLSDTGGDTVIVDPRTVQPVLHLGCCPPGPLGTVGNESIWGADTQDGSVVRWNAQTYQQTPSSISRIRLSMAGCA